MQEGAHINCSLLALGNCIHALSEKGGSRTHYVNFRDSKLTRLLKVRAAGWVCVCTCAWVCVQVCSHVCVCGHVCALTYLYVQVHVLVCVLTCLCVGA